METTRKCVVGCIFDPVLRPSKHQARHLTRLWDRMGPARPSYTKRGGGRPLRRAMMLLGCWKAYLHSRF